jgi:exodeoxyribonuclease V alpha subunit
VKPAQDHIEEALVACVHRLIFIHPETGFTILSAKTGPQNSRVIVLGELGSIKPGQYIRFHGRFERNPKHGRQFRAIRWEEIRPETREGLIRYLAGQFDGIGPALATRIVDTLGTKTLDILDSNPERLASIPGIGKRKTAAILRNWTDKRALADTSVFLSFLKLGPLTAQKIIRQYGFAAEQVIRDDPYRLAADINGIGFVSADDVAARLDITGDDPRRVRAAIRYELEKARDEGHMCLPRNELISRCVSLLDVPGKTVNAAIESSGTDGEVTFRSTRAGTVMVFDKSLDWVEKNVSDTLKKLVRSPVTKLGVDISKLYADELRTTGLAADKAQYDALNLAWNTPVFVITGGPGTGKTTLIRMLIRIMRNLKIRLAAPTGRAAQRMTETSGMEAATIHRLLEFVPQTGCFNRNARRPLNAGAVIIDESSMLDAPLAMALLRALKKGTRLIWVGDVDQLPSVGPGRVLGDIIESGIVPVVRLNRIYRQESGSRIVLNAHRIIRGDFPVLENGRNGSDFIFIEKDSPEDALDIIHRLPHRIARHLGVDPLTDVQVLSPMHRGLLGVQNLNETLRQVLNPTGKPIPAPGGYRLGDKVMQTKNNYDQEVFNGDIGRILQSDSDGRTHIRFGGRTIVYSPDALEQITPAFASSIHKSQGSEYPAVVIPLHTQHFVMLRRQLLYTAVTRGKRLVVLVGSQKALRLAVKNSEENARHTLLKERLQKT